MVPPGDSAQLGTSRLSRSPHMVARSSGGSHSAEHRRYRHRGDAVRLRQYGLPLIRIIMPCLGCSMPPAYVHRPLAAKRAYTL